MSRARRVALAAGLALGLAATPAAADEPAAAGWHVGVDLRTDLRAHPLRLGGGLRVGAVDVTLVLDPLVLADGEHDADLVVAWPAGRPWWGFAGARVSAVALDGGVHWQDKSLVGLGATLPRLGALRARMGVELAVLWVKHGGGPPTAWIGVDRGIGDHLQFGMWLRLEVGRGP